MSNEYSLIDRAHPMFHIKLKLVQLVNLAMKRREPPLRKHVALSLPRPSSQRVAIVVDGLGSSSASRSTDHVAKWLEEANWATCRYSYAGIRTHFYEAKDTLPEDFKRLAAILNDYVTYYTDADELILIGYSLGGMIIWRWLHECKVMGSFPNNVHGCCLIASL